MGFYTLLQVLCIFAFVFVFSLLPPLSITFSHMASVSSALYQQIPTLYIYLLSLLDCLMDQTGQTVLPIYPAGLYMLGTTQHPLPHSVSSPHGPDFNWWCHPPVQTENSINSRSTSPSLYSKPDNHT